MTEHIQLDEDEWWDDDDEDEDENINSNASTATPVSPCLDIHQDEFFPVAPSQQQPLSLDFEPIDAVIPSIQSSSEEQDDNDDDDHGFESDNDDDDDDDKEEEEDKQNQRNNATLLQLDEQMQELSDAVYDCLPEEFLAGHPRPPPTKRQKLLPPRVLRNNNHSHACTDFPVMAAYKSTTAHGNQLCIKCDRCKEILVSLGVGDILKIDGKIGLIRSIGSTNSQRLHLQELETHLTLPGDREIPLLPSSSTLILGRGHIDVSLPDLSQAWLDNAVQHTPATSNAFPPIFDCSRTQNVVQTVDFTTCQQEERCRCFRPWRIDPQEQYLINDLIEFIPLEHDPPSCCDVQTKLGRVISQTSSSYLVQQLTLDITSTLYSFKLTNSTISVPAAHICRKVNPFFDFDSQVQVPLELLTTTPTLSLKSIDAFAGMGGLSLGLEASGVTKTAVAIDGFKAALDTFASSHKDAKVYKMDVCEWMQKGCKDAPDDDESLLLLQGGPPCQGFSNANATSKESKLEKNMGMALFLELILRTSPDVVIIENVKGLLSTPGIIDSIFKFLASQGYQVRLVVPNAGSFGVAQNRVRVIFIAVKAKLRLPEAPYPTHIFRAGGYDNAHPEAPCDLKSRISIALRNVPRWCHGDVIIPRNALLPALTVADIIGDLPDEEGEEVEYKLSPPMHPFQAKMRPDANEKSPSAGFERRVTCHVSNFSNLDEKTQTRINLIPKDGPPRTLVCEHPQHPPIMGDWRDLPEEQLPDELKAEDAAHKPSNYGRFGRLTWLLSHLSTLLTRSCTQLNSKTSGAVIHPSANRPLTIREAARVQGIPDNVDIKFSVKAEGYRQCGNGVPLPLAEALGRSIKKALYYYSLQQN